MSHALEVLGELLMHDVGQVTSIVKDHVQRLAILESSDGLLDTPVVFLLTLTLPGKDGDPSCSNTRIA